MISFLSGKIILKKEKFIVLEVNGVGYKVFMSRKNLLKLDEIHSRLNLDIFCFLSVRENGLDLYGFLTQEELELFEVLNSIKGVGPKAALEISSLGSLEKIKEGILNQNEKLFEEIPGIGRKKAMAIILELSGKIKNIFKEKTKSPDETEEALVNLGFSRQQAKEALKKIPPDIEDVEEKIKQCLKILSKR